MNKKKLLISMLCCVICCGVLSAASIGEDEFFPLGEGGLNSGHFLRDYVVYDGVTKTIHYPIFDEELLNKVKEHDSNINSLDQLQFYNFVKGWNYRWDGAGKNCFQDFSEYEKLVVEFTEAIPYEVMLKVQGDELADDDNGKHQNAKGSRTVIAKASAGAIAMSLNLKEATEEFSANALTTEQLQNIEYVYFQMNYPTDRGALLKLKNVYLTKKSDNNAQVTVTTQGLKAVKDKVVTEVSFYSPSIVRIQKYDENANVAKHELVVTLSPENVSMTSEQNETLVTLRSDETTVTFNKTEGSLF